jgi:tRNA (cmo5U34)-methyltransferase
MTTQALEEQRRQQESQQQASPQPKSRDKLEVPTDWTFHSKNVADNFDIHVREQLPWYDLATGMVAHIGRHYLPENGLMYDLGASTGNITHALASELDKRKVKAISIDNAEPMKDVWRGVGDFEVADIREYDYKPYDFCACFLVLMFLPPVQQRQVFEKLYKNLNPGGALVIFDKTASYNGYLGTVMHRVTLAGKVATGVPSEAIVKKELSLAGAQRPIDPDALLFQQYGVKEVFRFGEFAGWVATK